MKARDKTCILQIFSFSPIQSGAWCIRYLGIGGRKAIIEEENVARDAARAYAMNDFRPLGELLGRIARLVQRFRWSVQTHVRKRGGGRHVRVEVRVLMDDVGPVAFAQKRKHGVAQPRFVAEIKRKSETGRYLARKRLEFFCKRRIGVKIKQITNQRG
jgi:hypothetical protein